jgi:hypothetical protein
MEKYLRVNLLRPGPRLIKKNNNNNLPGRGLTTVEKHCSKGHIKCNKAASIRETNSISARRLDDFKTKYNVSVYFSVAVLPFFRGVQTTRARHFCSD